MSGVRGGEGGRQGGVQGDAPEGRWEETEETRPGRLEQTVSSDSVRHEQGTGKAPSTLCLL
eukprot:scaffold235822_cov20-Tisochrysis_lutea.AAC.2